MGIKFLFLFVSSVKWSITRAHIFSCFLSSALSLSFISMAYISAGVSAGMQTILSSRYLIATSEETHVLYENVFKAVCSAQISHPSPALLTTSMKYNKYQALMWHMMRVLIPILDLEFFHFFFSLFLPLLPVNATQPDRRKSRSESRLFFFFFHFFASPLIGSLRNPWGNIAPIAKDSFFFFFFTFLHECQRLRGKITGDALGESSSSILTFDFHKNTCICADSGASDIRSVFLRPWWSEKTQIITEDTMWTFLFSLLL